MESRRKFRPRPYYDEPLGDRGTKDERLCGWPFNAVGASRERNTRWGGNPKPSRLESTR